VCTFIAEGHRQSRLQRRLRSLSVVILQHSAEPFTAFDSASNEFNIIARLSQRIPKSLMVPFNVIVADLFTNGILQ
jgi:hypothetical protein